ncbi:EPN2 [Bugula neritina]|uniref:EPN2 n=1 Tax=Bugula neritina TaxID=10212 RepID=A0A7J7K4P8_BUGNE|nr:EPN2 [Bugula neritina]
MPVLRSVKNIVKNYTDAEVKVREATSNDPWGPSSTLMAEIADLTYNVVAFTEIMQMIWRRLNDHGKNWRHVYKSLTLLEYIMKTGSEKVAQQCKENIFAIQTLKDFQHLEDNKDLGANVREKAKALVALLKDDERLKNERTKALKAKERFTESFGIGSDSTSTQMSKPKHHKPMTFADSAPKSTNPPNPELEEARPHSAGEEELQLQLALAMSKEEAENDAKKQTNDDLKLQMAIEESKKEETTTQEEHLLDFAGGSGAAPQLATNDPWNPMPASDPWAPAPQANTASPFSPLPSAGANDPWASSPSAPTPSTINSNPWDTTPPVSAVANDPWSTTTPAAPIASSSSPWDTGFSNGSSLASKPATEDDDFDMLGMRSTPSSQPAVTSSNGQDLFDMSSVHSTLPPIQTHGAVSLTGPKKPEDFLDQKAKTLVNLDSLITKPASATGVVNPFAMTGVGANGPSHSAADNNPFTAQQPARPSLNQMSAGVPSSGFNTVTPNLANPMMPMAAPYPGMTPQQPLYQQPMMYPQQPAASNMNNPFL